jgi:ribokinase
MDIGFDVDTLPRPGETALAGPLRSTPGGKGGNQAVAAARAGADVQFVGAVGDDPAAAQLREHLQDNGVGTDGLITVSGRSGTAAIVVDSAGENFIIVAPGANGELTLDSAESHRPIAECEVLLLQLEIPIATAKAAAREAHSAGVTVILNASPSGSDDRELAELAELAEVTDVLVVNETEAAHWVWPVPHRVTTLGARGASYIGDDAGFTVASPAVNALDTSGAGDVFVGVLAAGWAVDRHRAMRRACAAGALATLIPGAGDCAPYAEAIDDAALSD